MGKAGYLPDISGRFSFWTSVATRELSACNYDAVIGALDNLNSLLGEEYRIIISTDEYNKRVLAEKFFVCNHCTMQRKEKVNEGEDDEYEETVDVPREVNYSDVHVFQLKNQYLKSIVLKSKATNVWRCPECRNINRLYDTTIIKSEFENPFYVKAVPDPPIRTSSNRVGFNKKFREWFNRYFKELENALMLYRIEYIKENDEDMAYDFDKGDKP